MGWKWCSAKERTVTANRMCKRLQKCSFSTAVTMYNRVVTRSAPAGKYRVSEERTDFSPEEGCSTHVRNAGTYLQVHTTSHTVCPRALTQRPRRWRALRTKPFSPHALTDCWFVRYLTTLFQLQKLFSIQKIWIRPYVQKHVRNI